MPAVKSIKSILYIFFYAGYLLTCIAAVISPRYLGIFVFLVIGIMPYTLSVLAIAILQMSFSKKKWIKGLAMAMSLLAVFQLMRFFEWSSASEPGEIKVMSFNASFFRIPSVYSPEYFNPVKPTINEKMVKWILDQQADIMCLQEFFDDNRSTEYDNLAILAEMGDYEHYFLSLPRHDNGVSWGIVIFSRYPILNREVVFLSDDRYKGTICIKVQIGPDTVQILNTHLRSSLLAFKDMKSPHGIKNNLNRLRKSTRIRGEQIDKITRYLSGSPYPVIICGDYNSTRLTYVYNELSSRYKNAFTGAGNGFGFTHNGAIKLPLKIDHQFYSEHFEVKSCIVDNSMLDSDHFPVIATYNFNGN